MNVNSVDMKRSWLYQYTAGEPQTLAVNIHQYTGTYVTGRGLKPTRFPVM